MLSLQFRKLNSAFILFLLILALSAPACKEFSQAVKEAEKQQSKDRKEKKHDRKERRERSSGGAGERSNLALGNPSNASAEPKNADNYLIERTAYSLSYNRSREIPNWVSWELQADDIGDLKRPPFHPDNELPNGWYAVTPDDYKRSGYTRGHMCPASDRSSNEEDSNQVFSMVNIVPQTSDNNQGPWERLESYCRSLAEGGYTLFITSGGYGYSKQNAIDDGKIAVPANVWKVIVAVPSVGDYEDIDGNTRVIAVDMPNKQGIKDNDWRDFRVNVKSIEAATGYKFFTSLSGELQDKLKQKIDKQ